VVLWPTVHQGPRISPWGEVPRERASGWPSFLEGRFQGISDRQHFDDMAFITGQSVIGATPLDEGPSVRWMGFIFSFRSNCLTK
jgi:hypothetical protein